MRTVLLVVVLVLSWFHNPLFSQNSINLVSNHQEEVILNIKIDEYKLNEILTPKGPAQILTAPDAHAIREKGAPDLPKLVRSIIIPDIDQMEVEVTASKFIEIGGIEIAPSKGHFSRNQNPDSIPFVYGACYERDGFYPGKLTNLNEPYILRDFRGQALDIYPFQYNPGTKTLRIYTELTIRVYSTGKTGENILIRNRLQDNVISEFQTIYNRQFINFNDNLRYTPLEEEGGMLIICFDNFQSAMQPFVEWKNTIGISTEMVALSVVGTTPAAIKSYISNYYNTNNLAYVLLVGDAEQIPPYNIGLIEGYSDNAYGYLAGSDRYQEIFIGRFSAQNIAQVQTQVQRSLEYEQAYDLGNGWLHHGLGIARNEGAGMGHNGGEADYVHMDLIRGKLLNYTYDVVYREYDGNVPGLTNTTAAQISQRINNGVGIINFCNHGSVTGWSVAGYSATHVNALTNAGKLPFIWAVACVNGQFQGQTCFAETWLRATNSQNEPTGAVAVFMSTINQPWHPPMDAQDEFNDIMTELYTSNIKRTYGGISINGVFKMLDLNPNSNGYKTAETWTVFGDPTLKIRTANAIAMNVSHDPHISYGTGDFEIACNAEGAFAVITRDGEIISTASGIAGFIAISTSELSIGDEVTLAITAYNCIPYIVELDVVSSGPYANFIADPITPATGETVVFTDASGGGVFSSWEWNFGEGAVPATAIGQGPHEVVYNTPGGKTISLTVDGIYFREKANYLQVKDWFTLSIEMNGAGSVSVDGVPFTGSLILKEGSMVSLLATADATTTFTGWSGDAIGTSNPLNLLMDGNKNIIAGFSFFVSATYSAGDISTDYSFQNLPGSSSCPGTLSVSIPMGAIITAVNVSYSMTTANNGWMSEQRSQLRCISPGGIAESTIAAGSGSIAGTFLYNRTGLNIANSVPGGGAIQFQLHAGRTWGGSGCNTTYNRVNNNSWTIKVFYLPPVVVPSVETAEAADILSTSAQVGGNIISSGGAEVSDRGVFLSLEPNPDITGTLFSMGGGSGEFSGVLDNLVPKTTYYVKAYAINSAGMAYGHQVEFTTALPAELQLENVTVTPAHAECFDATQTIILSGAGCVFIVEADASAEIVAGHNIIFLEGTSVNEGAYFLARIATNNDYCSNPETMLMARNDESELAGLPNEGIEEPAGFQIFPNPSNGTFTVALDAKGTQAMVPLVIYNLMGGQVLQTNIPGSGHHHFDLSAWPKGVYLVRVMHGQDSGFEKIIIR